MNFSIKVDDLPVFGDHGVGQVRDLVVVVKLELQFCHRIEKFGQMLRDLQRLISIRQDIEKVIGRCEVKPVKHIKSYHFTKMFFLMLF